MPTTWTKITKASGTSWTKVVKPVSSVGGWTKIPKAT